MSPASPHGEHFAEVVVVRHGETSWNASRVIQGQMDPELNETGRKQTIMLARRLSKEAKPAAVYSSDLKRAAETAKTIAAACDVSNLVFDQALRERHMGDLHGQKFDDAVKSKPEAYKAFSSGDRSQEIPVTNFHSPLKILPSLSWSKTFGIYGFATATCLLQSLR
jgi:probable phosphoglycerate mutase